MKEERDVDIRRGMSKQGAPVMADKKEEEIPPRVSIEIAAS